MFRSTLPTFLLVVLASGHCLCAAERGTDEAAIQAVVTSYVDAFNHADAQALAELWAEDAEYQTPDGPRLQGREAIKKMFAAMFAESQHLKLEVLKPHVRFVTADVAIEEGTARVTSDNQPPDDSTYVAIHVRKNGGWRLNSVHETVAPSTPTSQRYGHLRDLEALVGDWSESREEGKPDDGTSHCRFAWTKSGAFLTADFKVAAPDGDELEGTMNIGWDPEASVIRSWMFDSDGGFGEGLWTQTDQGWSVRFVQVLPDGRRAGATNVYSRIDENTLSWQSIGRKVEGRFAPNIGPVKLVRKPTGRGAVVESDAKRGESK